MDKVKLLFSLRDKYRQLKDEASTFKSKAAREKRYEKARRVSRCAYFVLYRLFPEGTKITLNQGLFCTDTFGGGGYVIEKGQTIETLTVGIDYFTFSCGDQVFNSNLFSEGWCKGSLYALLGGMKCEH